MDKEYFLEELIFLLKVIEIIMILKVFVQVFQKYLQVLHKILNNYNKIAIFIEIE